MATIYFWTWDEPGHVNPALAIALRLARRGHAVGFIAGDTVAASITSHGFEVAAPPFDAYRGPKGACRSMDDAVGAIRGLKADLILCDALRTFEAAAVMAAGARAAVYSTSLPFWSDSIGPRIDLCMSEPETGFDRLRVRLAWWRNGLRQRGYRWKWFARHQGYRDANRLLEQVKRSHGMCAQDIGWNSIARVPLPWLRCVPALVLCPRALDFPRSDGDGLLWTDACILDERPGAPPQPELGLASEKPLIYVSLGTQVHRVRWAREWFVTVCAMFQRHPEWQAVLAVGDVLAPELAGHAIPGRVAIVARAAQPLLLRRAAVAVIHGGLNSVKECIAAGVPMAVFPTGHDQPGNAARIYARGLGLAGSGRNLRPEALAAMVRTLLEGTRYRQGVAAMREQFLLSEQTHSAVDAVESLIARTDTR